MTTPAQFDRVLIEIGIPGVEVGRIFVIGLANIAQRQLRIASEKAADTRGLRPSVQTGSTQRRRVCVLGF